MKKNVLALVLTLVLMFTLASAALAMGPPPGDGAGGPPPDGAGGAAPGGAAPGGAPADAPATGDNAMTAVWALLAGLSVCGLAAVVVEKKVRSNH